MCTRGAPGAARTNAASHCQWGFAGAGVQKVEELKLNIDTVSNTVVQVVRMRIKFMAERRPR